MKKIFSLWTPVFIWAGVLFYFSSIPNLRAVENNFWDEIIRSFAHFVLYGLGYFLFFRALNFGKEKKNFWLPLVFTVVYGLFDEIHQIFVPTRSFQLKDLFVDFGGAAMGYLVIKKRGEKMKKLITVILVMLLILGFAGTTFAQQDIQLPNPGITPDSPFYFLDTLAERISLVFTHGAEAKAKKALVVAEEKLAEAEAMADEGKDKAAEIAANRYGENISLAAGALAQAARTGEGFDEALKSLIAKATSIHLDVLSRVYDKVPEKAKEAIQKAMEKSSRGGEEALEAIETKETREKVQEEIQERRQEVKQRGPEEIPAPAGRRGR